MSSLLLRRAAHRFAQQSYPISSRAISTLQNNSYIYVHPPSERNPMTNILSLLPTSPPNPSLAVGTSPSIPPTPDSVQENDSFLRILQSVIREHATSDPIVQSQAQAYASTAGSSLGSGGVFFPQQQRQRNPRRSKGHAGAGPGYGGGGGAGGGGAGGASAQGGAGGGGVGGYIHVSDMRNPPDYGRIAWPEDIFGSLEVDGEGKFVGEYGSYQESGTYRICTREGILGLSPYLRERLVEKLQELEKTVP